MLIEMRPIDSVRPYESNPRINDDAVEGVAASIREFGFRQPIVVDSDNVIVAGHTRYKAAQKLGLDKVPVHVATDLSPEQARAYRLADKGRLCGENGDEGWILSLHDSHADARMHEQLVSVRFGIPQTCWKESGRASQRSLSHIEDLYANLDAAQLDRSADAALAAYHRLRQHPFVRNDDTRAKFGARQSIQVRACNLLPQIMEVPVPIGGQRALWRRLRAVDVQPYSGDVYSLGVDTHEHYIADGIVTHNCFYGWKEGAAHKFYGPANVSDLWHVKKIPPQQMEHLTAKPAELAVRAMQYSSLAGENVLDLFGGSGSTLIAAEQTGRRAYLMELDTLYCDVIVDRFQRFSGKAAVLQRTGDSPIAMKAREESMR